MGAKIVKLTFLFLMVGIMLRATEEQYNFSEFKQIESVEGGDCFKKAKAVVDDYNTDPEKDEWRIELIKVISGEYRYLKEMDEDQYRFTILVKQGHILCTLDVRFSYHNDMYSTFSYMGLLDDVGTPICQFTYQGP